MPFQTIEEVLQHEKVPPIIEEIIPQYKELEEGYLRWMEYWWEDDNIPIGVHLAGLSNGIYDYIKKKNYSIQTLKGIFNIIEKYLQEAKNLNDKYTLGTVYEIGFFESVLNRLSNIDDKEEKKATAHLLHSVIGPIGLELCKSNDKFWGTSLLPYADLKKGEFNN